MSNLTTREEVVLKAENIDAKISLQLIPAMKILERKAASIIILVWIQVAVFVIVAGSLAVWVLANGTG